MMGHYIMERLWGHIIRSNIMPYHSTHSSFSTDQSPMTCSASFSNTSKADITCRFSVLYPPVDIRRQMDPLRSVRVRKSCDILSCNFRFNEFNSLFRAASVWYPSLIEISGGTSLNTTSESVGGATSCKNGDALTQSANALATSVP